VDSDRLSDVVRERLYSAYTSTHAGLADGRSTALVFRRDIAPLLPERRDIRLLDIGCGQGHLVQAVRQAGYLDVHGVDISGEQVAQAHAGGLHEQVQQGDFREVLGRAAGTLDVVLATDVLEHLTRNEVVATMDLIRMSLKPTGMVVARVPNAGSPFGGHIRYGDLTHESWFTVRSLRQLTIATGFRDLVVVPCKPVRHGMRSTLRAAVWAVASTAMKLALAAETGAVRGHMVTQNMTFRATAR
jgi:2-polyprenyl-3-methyl-5-hydroxy-6-metoxy-1,4-benzoquinol methylase